MSDMFQTGSDASYRASKPPPNANVVRASSESDCPSCDFSIAIGDEIIHSEADRGWVHRRCA